MVIEINQNVFKERDFKSLNFFIQLCTYKNRYEVYADINEELLNSNGYKRLDYDDQLLLQDNYNCFATNQLIESDIFLSSNYIITTEVSEEKNKFTIEEGIRFFMQPLSIILENSKNDAYFMNAVFNHFSTGTRIQNHIDNNWIQFENAGGCDNILNFIEGKKQSFNSLPKTDKSKYLRCFVLMDSDKLHPLEELRENKLKTVRQLKIDSIAIHVLEKRSIENYVPIEAILNLGIIYKEWTDFYNLLSNLQKDYFSIEKGLCSLDKNQQPKKTREQINVDTNNLYEDIMTEPLIENKYINGLKHLGYGSFKENFPKLFELPIINKDSLKNRANSEELEEIIQKINDLL
jgi:hypothetical protein